VLAALGTLAPVIAVRGNTDSAPWARDLPLQAVIEVGGLHLCVVHDLAQLDLDPKAAGVAAVVFGHSHRPQLEERGGVLYINPGSAGPRRFTLPVSVARLRITGGRIEGEIVRLAV
jgi:putative phosphoesterase